MRTLIRTTAYLLLGLTAAAVMPSTVPAQIDVHRDVPCCQLEGINRVVWLGTETTMTMVEIAAHCGPVVWFSPDEPLLKLIEDPLDINIPMAFPFEEPSDGPVVYYRFRTIMTREAGNVFLPDSTDLNNSLLDLSNITAIEIDYFFYYPSEEGFARHEHDVESVEMKVAVARQPDCAECTYGLVIMNVNGKAHGIRWYDNTLETDKETHCPVHILVEEGKHASCTDKNADGYYTPGYDVNKRVNDAWGVRDVLSTGALFSGGFESWFAKVRVPDHRVFPPLPESSRVRRHHTVNGVYAPGNAIYSLRTWPTVEAAEKYPDKHMVRFVDKGYHDWPNEIEDSGLRGLTSWIDEEGFVKSISIAFRMDNELGVSVIFPLFVIKSFNEPVTGGWFVNRLVLKGNRPMDIIWNVLYTTSASRWIDGYFAAGVEWKRQYELVEETEKIVTHAGFMTETGVKFRFNIAESPVSFLSSVTDFWGLRVGVRYIGYKNFSEIGYAVEIGAGSF